MAYADSDFYNDTYLGHEESDTDLLARYLQRASNDIDSYCLSPIDTSDLNDDAILNLKMATCAQAEYYVFNGDEPESDVSGGLGSFHITGTQKKLTGGLDKKCLRYLAKTGLAGRGII